MSEGKIIVCEKRGNWATALRMVLPDLQGLIRETRTMVECLREIELHPSALIVLELRPERFELQACSLLDILRRFPDAAVVVVADRGMEQYELAVREIGVSYFLCSPRKLVSLGRLIRRHLEQVSSDRPRELKDMIWSRLPWGGD